MKMCIKLIVVLGSLVIIAVVFNFSQIDKKYKVWGDYYRTKMMIMDGSNDVHVFNENQDAFTELLQYGEIHKVEWDERNNEMVMEYIQNNKIESYRYGHAFNGGQWPAKNKGGFGYFYKYEAVIINKKINSAQQGVAPEPVMHQNEK